MNCVASHRLSGSFKGVEGLAKFAVMEASEERPSFLCFLPESRCSPANILFTNGIAESIATPNNSGKVVPRSLDKRSRLSETFDIAHRFSDASVTDDQQSSNGHSADHDLQNMTAGLDLQNVEITERENGQIAECSDDQDALSDGSSSGEVDVPAFEITEFFNIYRAGNEGNSLKRTQMRDLLPPETLAELEGIGPNSSILDQQTKSDKVLLRVGVDHIDGRTSPTAGRLGNWNCFSEPDSFSGTLSGPLTFSGPMSFSGNSGPVLYSGSASHRSDSSTASSRSFAFPILPFEWNSSPVKMSKPEKRSLQRSWKRRLCCIFCCASSLS